MDVFLFILVLVIPIGEEALDRPVPHLILTGCRDEKEKKKKKNNKKRERSQSSR